MDCLGELTSPNPAGGASLRFGMGVQPKEICYLGHRQSDCYQLYLRQYTEEEKAEATCKLMKDLDACWAKCSKIYQAESHRSVMVNRKE
ncbi:hypothetical protein PCANC_12405 [Puccinia coronata f. sp. avenae]|uniref:Uncharacterized protein n=1 Tax=Puccinia coronata f. sp. avenae TaxID=200324 RepID=A0A2N5VB68_9BASI|nr:hypothetical protein PCANC_12405 [Puccinia coronata f. sp. avenae]